MRDLDVNELILNAARPEGAGGASSDIAQDWWHAASINFQKLASHHVDQITFHYAPHETVPDSTGTPALDVLPDNVIGDLDRDGINDTLDTVRDKLDEIRGHLDDIRDHVPHTVADIIDLIGTWTDQLHQG